MKFIKFAFFACLCSFVIVNNAMAEFCNASNPTPVGKYCWATQTYTCESGCYCSGGNDVENGGLLNNCNPSDGTFKFGAISHSSPVAGVHVCPSTHPNSNPGAGSVNDCYQLCNADGYNVRYAYYQHGCGAGLYLPKAHENCAPCPAGKYCKEETAIISSCDSNQGISGSCDTGNKYSDGGDEKCIDCDEAGKAVVKDNGLNVGCDVCVDGTYANDGHTACETCEAGYACTNGVRNPCTGNQYSSVAGASQCTECTENGKAVVKNGTLNVGCDVCDEGTYANDDHSQCIVCPAGYACSNGFKNDGLCPPGTCAANANGICVSSGGVQCKTCSEINSSKPYSIPARTQCVKCDNPVDYYENGECQNCPNVEYNQTLYTRVRIDGQSGKAMCGIKLNTSSSNTPSLCSVESLVQWHIVNDAWKLVEEFSVKADMRHYVKDPSPTSPDGSDADADWCGTCPTGKFNIYANRTGESACVACPAGYCTSGNSCLKCCAGYYCPGTNGVANSCSGGTVVVDGERYGIEQTEEEEEYKCKKGSFSAPGQVSCTKCASGYTTDIDGKPYDPDHDDLNDICQKIKIRLIFNNNQWKELPDIFKNVKMNASVLQPQQ